MGYIVAKYIRLSIEDAKTESLSIENQRRQLDTCIAGMPQTDIEVLDFVDNGFSGTNLDRPQFQQLLELVRTGQVDCILVKDFSRLGRNSIDTGYFVEKVFPLYQVRLVALGDGYDSGEKQSSAGAMEMTFKFLINEFYSIQMGQKIRAAKATKMKRGLYVTKNCAFGYQLDKRRNMVIDPKSAKTVRQIFDMALQGCRVSEIAQRLYLEGQPTPGAYKGHKLKRGCDPQLDCVWGGSVIRSILRDEQYTGTYVAGKSTVLEVGSKKKFLKAESEWVRIPDHHAAIIDREQFDAVQTLLLGTGKPHMRKRSAGQKKLAGDETFHPLHGKTFCGHCGRALRYAAGQAPSFQCAFTRRAPGVPCHKLSIGAEELSARVLAMAREALGAALAEGGTVGPQAGGRRSAPLSYAEKVQRLFEQFVAGEITDAMYKDMLASLDAEHQRTKMALTAPATLLSQRLPGGAPVVALREVAQKSIATPMLTQELVDILIDRVLVHPGGEVAVHWKIAALEARQGDKEGLKDAG